LIGLLALDLIGLGSTLEIEPNDPTLGFQHQDVVNFLHQDPNLYRIEATVGAWQPDAALVHGLYDTGGIFNPLGLAPYHAYLGVAKGERGAPLYNLLAAKYVLAPKGAAPGDARLTPVYDADPQIDVYMNTNALPMALIVHEAIIVDDHTAAWMALFEGFDPTQAVILEQNQATNQPEIKPLGEKQGDDRIEFVKYTPNEIVLNVNISDNGWLVLSEVYYPGWRAEVNDTPTEVLRANYTFRAIVLAPGEHVVTMYFSPWTWRVGATLSAITWGIIVVWLGLEIKSWWTNRNTFPLTSGK
jgi:hypothetical protein